ncbi:g11899 [Coccomyxa elongata]
MSVATLRHQMSCPSDFMRVGTVIPLEVSTSEGPAAHHTVVGDSFLRSGRPIKTRFVEKSQKVPRTPKTPAKTPGMPKTYTSGDQTFMMPPCSLEGVHSSQLGHGRISIKSAFSGATLFITGASGYVGSVVLEQLLRFCPDVAQIYLLIRGKRGNSGEQRLDALLARPLFHLHRKSGEFPSEVRRKLVVVNGDLGLPGLGLSPEDRSALIRDTQYIVHSAASISFVDHIHRLIAHNYVATRNMAQLASEMRQIKSFLHVSTAYVNCHLGRDVHVEERQYPFTVNGRPVSHADIIAELAALAPEAAERRAKEYLQQSGHVNTYTFTKMLTELAIAEFNNTAFPVAIVRPSIVGAIAKHPYPGYFGNSAGPTAYFLAFGSGIATMTCHRPHNIFDLVPCDVVGSVILATSAASVQNSWDRSRPLIVHAASSTSYPISHYSIYKENVYPYWSANPAKFRFNFGGYQRYDASGPMSFYQQEGSAVFKVRQWLGGIKFWIVCGIIRALGYPALAKKVWAGWQAWQTYNTPKLDFQLFFCSVNAKALARLLVADELKQMPLQWEAEKDDSQKYFQTHLEYMQTYFFGGKEVKLAKGYT